MRVLIVEDDPSIAEPLEEGLSLGGFEPVTVETGEAAIALAGGVDVVLLDLGLPDLDGFEVCRRIREFSSVPIIVVSARGEELDRVLGFERGADDYVVKPFSMRELIARIRVHTRRRPAATAMVRFGSLLMDRRVRQVTLADEEIDLTPKEFDLLEALLDDPGAVVRREDLMEQVWDTNWFGSTKTIDVHVASLRRKLGDPGWVETVRGIGFKAVAVR